MIYVGVLGSSGRMGKAVIDALASNPRCALSMEGTRENADKVFNKSDVLIDFTSPDALSANIHHGLSHKKPMVIGTTGLTDHHTTLIYSASSQIPIVLAPNMSLGVTLISTLIEKAASFLDETYDIEISELHHRHKIDAPSGTALMLGSSAAKGRRRTLKELQCPADRKGLRTQGSIGFSVQRGGSVFGDHSIRFIGDEEIVELSHRGLSRSSFAKGAVRAAEWLVQQKPGQYSMIDVLGL